MDIAVTFNLAILLTFLVSLFVFIYKVGRAAEQLDTLQESVDKLSGQLDSFQNFVRDELQLLNKAIIRIETRLDYQGKSPNDSEKT